MWSGLPDYRIGGEGVNERRRAYNGGVDWSQCSAVDRDPGKLGGQWCFKETRLPVVSLFEALEKGSSLDEFLEWFPDLDPNLAHEVLDFAKKSLEQPVTVP